MARLLAILTVTSLLCCTAAAAAPLPGQMLLVGGNHVDLYRPASGDVRRVVQGGDAVLFPSGRELAYIREVGCFPTGETSCYTEYSIFEKSLEEAATEPGRGTFGPTDFFVRGVDVAPRGKLVFSAKPGPGPPEGWERQMEIFRRTSTAATSSS